MHSKQLSILSASENGTLAFLPAPEGATRLVWVDAKGHEDGDIGEAGNYDDAALSPDGKRIAVVRSAPDGNDIWLVDASNGSFSRFTFHPGLYGFPCWSRDSKQIAFFLQMDATGQVCTKSLDGAERTPVLMSKAWQLPNDFSPDGTTLLTFVQTPSAAGDLYTLTLGPKPAMTPFVATPFDESAASFSPDGRWVAYQSNASMRNEVYVRRYPLSPEQWQISNAGGESPMWGSDGKELRPDRRRRVAQPRHTRAALPHSGTSHRAAPERIGVAARDQRHHARQTTLPLPARHGARAAVDQCRAELAEGASGAVTRNDAAISSEPTPATAIVISFVRGSSPRSPARR
jgi:Tol biopolymer transport system component